MGEVFHLLSASAAQCSLMKHLTHTVGTDQEAECRGMVFDYIILPAWVYGQCASCALCERSSMFAYETHCPYGWNCSGS